MAKKTAQKKGPSDSKLIRLGGQFILIFFSVTLALLFNEWRNSQKDRALETFYLGQMEVDVTQVISNLEQESDKFKSLQTAKHRLQAYILHNTPLSDDSLLAMVPMFYPEIYPSGCNLAFETMRQSGKLEVLANKTLLRDLFYLDQQAIPLLQRQIDSYLRLKREQFDPYYLSEWPVGNRGGPELARFLHGVRIRNFLEYADFDPIIRGYENMLKLENGLLRQIQQERGQ